MNSFVRIKHSFSFKIDNSPPTISCVTPQIFYADRGITSTLVKWQLPTAFDKTDEHPSIVPRNGPIWGTVLEQGTEIVKYTAVDVDGNESPECLIELRIEGTLYFHICMILIDHIIMVLSQRLQ